MPGKQFIRCWKILLVFVLHFCTIQMTCIYDDYSLMFTDVKVVCNSLLKSCLFVSTYTYMYNRSVVKGCLEYM